MSGKKADTRRFSCHIEVFMDKNSLKVSIIALTAAFFFLFPAHSHAKIFKEKASVMGTDVEMTVSAGDASKAEDAFNAAAAELKRIEDEMSEWKEGTYVSEINRNAGIRPVKVPQELFNVIAASKVVSGLSNGAFDVSWAALRGLWDFTNGKNRVPADEELKKRLPLINFRNIELGEKETTVFLKKKGMAIGLGAIAKGYAVDMAMKKIAGLGIKNAIVKAGGDMRVQGTDDGGPWEIGIRHPRERDKLLAELPLSNISISTSGDYERFFIKDGVLYHHIIDTKTGYPARGCRSVTILAPDTMTSDALSTAVFVLGPDEGMKLIKRLKGVEGIIVDSAGAVRYSPGITAGK